MAQSNYQEPIEQKDLDLAKKIKEANIDIEKNSSAPAEKKEIISAPEIVGEIQSESNAELHNEKESEKIETARKTISAQQTAPASNVASDAKAIIDIQEFEKKVEKLVEIAMHKGPEHAIQVAQHMDKGKDTSKNDNYTLDEIHDRLIEDEVRTQLIQKGLLKEL